MPKAVGVTARRTKARGREAVRLIGVMRRRRSALMVSTALQATIVLVLTVPAATSGRAQPAPNARPTGGQVVAGSATIGRSPSTTTINQSSQRAAVNWKSFDVGSQQSVQFQQPSSTATTLNRVTGPNPSQIAGRIDANGQIILVNQDGITFYKGAQVNAGGLMVSAAGITDKNFMAGRMVFDQAAHPNAKVENQGNITVKDTGLAALVAPQVVNSGVITAKLGHVVLAGARAATLDLYGDGLVSIDVTQQVTQVPVGPDGKQATALVTNTGTVIADGGTVQLTARAADGIVDNLITAGGRIAAGTAGGKAGIIALNGIGGSITVTGQLAATSGSPGVRGGEIEVVTNRGVSIAGTARLNASGKGGGGTVAVGTTLARAKGGSSVVAKITAAHVTVQKGAAIAANATGAGDGGHVAVLSTGLTQMDGAISAKGGPRQGNGGFVEVSGDTLGLTGSVDLSAPAGRIGTILLDPGTLDIVNAATAGLDGSIVSSGTVSTLGAGVGGATGSVSNTAINALGGDVVLQATTLLDVQASVSVAHGLTMQSGGDLLVGPGLSIQAGTTLLLGSGIVFPAGTVGANGSISIGNGAVLHADSLILQGGSTGVFLNGSTLFATSLLDISAAGGGVSQLSTGSILAAAGMLQSTSGIVGGLTLASLGNAIGTLGPMTVSGGDLNLATTSALTVIGHVVADGESISLTSGGPLSIGRGGAAGFLNAGTAGGILLAASGSISEPHGAITGGTFGAAASAGAVLLTGGADQIGTIVGITAPGDVAVIADPAVLTLSGPSTGRTLFFKNPDAGGTIELRAATLTATGGGGTPRISLVGDRLTQPVASTITLTSAGVVELAPATVGANTTIDVTPNSPVDTLGAVFGAIQPGTGTLAIGGFTGPDNAGTASARNIVVASTVDLTPIGNTLALLGTGTVSQLPGADLLNIGTLAGAAASLSLLNPGNQIGTVGGPTGIAGFTGLTAADGNIEIFDSRSLTITGPVTATGTTASSGNVFLQETAGNALTVAGSVTATNTVTNTNKLSLVTDALTASGAASILALGGTVEIAPATPALAVHMPSGVGGLIIDSTALGAVQTGTLAIGTYHDAVHGGTVALSGTLISFENNVSLATAAVPVLRLDTSGSIVQNAGTLAVGTLSASTHGAAGAGVTLTVGGAGNAIGVLGNFAVGNGDLLLNDGVKLTEPASSTVYADNVAINNQGSIALAGNLAASAGTIAIASTGANDITISGGLIGATGPIAFSSGGAFRQTGGTINGSDIVVLATTGVVQNGGTLYGFDNNPANTAVVISSGAGGDFVQTGGVIASNDQLSISSANALSANGNLVAVGNVTLAATGAFSSSGVALSGADLAVSGASINQTGGTLGAHAATTLTTTGTASQSGGIASGSTVDLIAGTIPVDGFQSFGGAIATVAAGSTAAGQIISGVVFPADPPGAPTGPLTLPAPAGAAGALHHLRIEADNSGYSFSTALAADWIEFHTLNDIREDTGGLLTATLLSGTAGYTAGSGFTLPGTIANADFRVSGNDVLNLGRSVDPFVTTGSFWLNDTGTPTLTVAGTVHAGSALGFGQTIELMALGLTIDDAATTSFPSGVSITTAGSLLAEAAIGATSVTPGVIQLQADDFSVLPSIPLAPVVSAPDGLVAIAPLHPGHTLTVLGNSPGPGILLVGAGSAPLAAISTLGALRPDTPATNTLALGSIDVGKTAPTAAAIVFDLNGGTIDLSGVAKTVQLNTTGAATETGAGTLIVPGLAGQAGSFAFEPTGTNVISQIGNSPNREAGGTIYHTDPTVLAGLGNLQDIIATSADARVHSTAGTMTVLGTVTVPSGHAIDLAAPTLLIDHFTTPDTLAAGSFLGLGSLVAGATVIGGTIVTPGQILLTADALRIEGTRGTPVVSAPDGMVAIAPFTAGNTVTVVNTLAAATDGTIAVQDLALINTIGTLASAPLGVATLAIGSTDGGATLPAGAIAIDAPFDVKPIAKTLSLFAANSGAPGAGLITQGAGDGITVSALTGSAGVLLSGSVAGSDLTSVLLPELNAIATIGVLPTESGFTSTFTGQGNLLATGDILVRNSPDLAVHTLVHAGDDPIPLFAHPSEFQTADLGASSGTVFVNGTVWAGIDNKLQGNIHLSGGSDTTIGAVAIPGSVFASTGGLSAGTVTVAAGFAAGTYNAACTAADCGIGITGVVWGNQGFGHADPDLAGIVQLNAASSIDESAGTIGGLLLTGGAGGFVNLSGGATSTPSQNWIATLGLFDSNLRFNLPITGTLAPGFLLRDGRVPASPLGAGLTVVGAVQDHGTVAVGSGSSGIEIMVRPTANAIADLVIQSSTTGTGMLIADAATGTVDIESTGNVYEQTGAAMVSGSALIGQAGVLPSSEFGGGAPGSIPGTPLSLASVWLGNVNQIGTVANATATQEFLLHNGPGLTVASTGTVLAGVAGTLLPAAGVPAPIIVHAHPTAEIDVDSSDLTVAFDGASTAIVHAGLNAARPGDVTLNAGGNVNINGAIFAADGGSVAVTAGGNVEIPGVVWGDGPPNGPAPQPPLPSVQPLPDFALGNIAGYITLQAGQNIDENGAIGTFLLRGTAQGHALLNGAGAPTQNDIRQLGSFDTNLSLNSPVTGTVGPGLLLRNESALAVVEPVTDHGFVAAGAGSSGISISVAPDGTLVANYGSADLVLQSTVTANANTGTVTLQATGNILEQAGGTVIATALIAQAGAIPDTEPVPQANHPGSIPISPVTLASALFGNANTLATLGNVTATQNFLLNNAGNPVDGTDANLIVAGTVLAGAMTPASPGTTTIPVAEIDVASSVGGSSNITIASGATIDAGFALAEYPGGNVVLHAGDTQHPGAISIAALGTVLAVPDGLVRLGPTTSGVALLTAGVSGVTLGTAGTPVSGPPQLGATFCAGCSIDIAGLVSGFPAVPAVVAPGTGSTLALYASGSIDEPGTIAATVLTGAAGGHATFAGTGAPTSNRIAQLGSFSTNVLTDDAGGFLLRDGQTLSVIGAVTDSGPTLSGGVSIAVAPPGTLVAGYGIADLDVNAPITAQTTVALQATGNVYESPGGIVVSRNLIAQAGAIPNTETTVAQANQPGSIPADPLALASVWLGNANQIGAVANATATQEFFLQNLPSLRVSGTVLAGAGPASTIAAATAGTPIVLHVNPTAEIDVTGGDLAVDGVVHAGLDGVRTGDATLTAGDVFINGGVFAAQSGAVSMTAGGSIEIGGAVWGDEGMPAALTSLVTLNAGTQIDEAGRIGAALLTGRSGWHASLTGANPHTGNQIANLGSFESDSAAGDPNPGFELHDGWTGNPGLAVVGIVQDDRAGVTVAVAPAFAAGYAISDLNILGTISAATAANLQATGNVYEGGFGGMVIASTLIAQSGAIPGTEVGGNAPGTIPAAPVSNASIRLQNVNQIGTLGNATATWNFLLSDGQALLIPSSGTVLAGAAAASVTPDLLSGFIPGTPDVRATINVQNGDLSVDGVIHAGLDATRTGNVQLNANDVFVNGGVYAANAGAVAIGASGSIEIPGTIWGDGLPNRALAGSIELDAGTQIDEPGQIGATRLVVHSGAHASLTGADPHTGNQIVNLDFANSDITMDDPAGFVLHDALPTLTITGPVTDFGSGHSQGVMISVAPAGTLAAGYGLGDLVIANTVSAATTVNLQATGNIYETLGSIVTPQLVAQAGAIPNTEITIAQANQPGSIPAVPLALASVWLGNINQVGTLAAATATQELLLKNGPNLAVLGGNVVLAGAAPGSLAAASVVGTPIVPRVNPTAEIDVNGDLTLAGQIHAGLDASRTGNVVLTAANLFAPGIAVAGDGGTLTAIVAGNLSETGTFNAGTATLAGASVSIGGTVNASSSTTATAINGLTIGGAINTGIATLNGASIDIAGAVNAGGSTTATATDAITIGGVVNTGTASLTGGSIAVAGAANATGSLAATAANGLSVAGTVNASNARLNAGAIDITGDVNTAQSLTLTAAGSINETGKLITPLLTGSAGTTANLVGVSQTANQIAQINGFSAGQTLTVNDGVNLLLSGRLAAPLLVVNDSPSEITLANGAVIATGGIARPKGLVLTNTNNPIVNHAAFGGGAYLTDFTQQGTSTITGINGGPSILGIDATAGHNIRFDPGGGLRGPTTWLVLRSTGNDTISGNVFVGALDVVVNGIGGSANLFGTIADLPGVVAAGAGNIAPSKNANFRFNSCAIGSVNCILLPAQAVPAGNPLNDFSLGAIANPYDEEDLLLPVVSDEDY